MRSTLDSDYWLQVDRLLASICKRPGMYFEFVSEYEAFLLGHETAFEQQGGILPDEAFRATFTKWLEEKKSIPSGTGWAQAITELAERGEYDPVQLFLRLIPEFLRDLRSGGPGELKGTVPISPD